MKKDAVIEVSCPSGVKAVGDKFIAGEIYKVKPEEAKKLIAAGKMVEVKGDK